MAGDAKERAAVEDWALGTLDEWFRNYTSKCEDPIDPSLGETQFYVHPVSNEEGYLTIRLSRLVADDWPELVGTFRLKVMVEKVT